MGEQKIPANQFDGRQEMKARMGKAQFSLGMNKDNTGMSKAQSLYSSEIDTQAKQGGQAANGQVVRS